MSLLAIDQAKVTYRHTQALAGINLHIEQGELVCLLGPSGCGKSTLLRTVAGFQDLDGGTIKFQNRTLVAKHINIPAEQRGIGMVFQDAALFPHLNVAQNIAFGLHQWPSNKARQRVTELLSMVGLSGFEERYPHQLSGGQQQRVALIRAIAPKPQLLLLDEPFSGLDAALREGLVPSIANLLRTEGMAAILVSHDQEEAFSFADKIAVINQGEIEQFDLVYNIYHQPKSRFVADFIGQGDFIKAQVNDFNEIESPLGTLPQFSSQFAIGATVDMFVRPDDVLHDDASPIKGRIVSRRFCGTHFLYQVQLNNQARVACFADSHHNHAVGEDIGICLNMEHILLFANAEASDVEA